MALRQLSPDPNSSFSDPLKIDIIAVHGLNPRSKDDAEHAWDTWRSPAGPRGRLWLRDDLPDYVPGSRIFLFEYNSTLVYGKDRSTFIDKANDLLEQIRIKRKGMPESRPILLLGHSMGGLLIKQALINASQNVKYMPIKNATKGLAFFATPHNGGDRRLVNLGRIFASIALSTGFQKGDNVLETLDSGSIFSDIMSEHWRQQILQYDIVSFWGAMDDIVPKDSARLGLPGERENLVTLKADHRTVCKFGKTDQTDLDNLERVATNIQDLYDSALQKRFIEVSSSSRPQRITYIPLRKNKRFTARNKMIEKLQQMFFHHECPTVALVGLGGIGKTQVALEFAYWVKECKPAYSIFWVSVQSSETFEQAYTEIAKKLLIKKDSEDEDSKESVRRYLSSETTDPWFLVVDNADDPDLLFGDTDTARGLQQYLPESERGLTLFTTRSRDVAVRVAESDVVDLPDLKPPEAKSVFEKSLIQKDLANESAAEELLRELTYLPLAITQAAAYLNRNQVPITTYLGLLRGTEDDMVSLMSREFRGGTTYEKSQNAVATTWLVSFEHIRKSDSMAAKLLCFISCIEPKAIPRGILPDQELQEEMEHAIGTLCGYAFLVRREDPGMFDMHSLVHMASRIWVKRNGIAERTITETIQHLKYSFPTDNYRFRKWWQEFLPHVFRALKTNEPAADIEEKYDLLFWVGRCLQRDGRLQEAILRLEECNEWRQRHLPEGHTNRLASQHNLASVYRDHGKVEKAIELLESTVAVQPLTLPEGHPFRLAFLGDLAVTYRANGQVKEAIELHQRIVATEAETLAEDNPLRLSSQHNLAVAYETNGQIKEAMELLEHVVAIKEVALAEDDPSRLVSQHQLAIVYRVNGKTKEAIDLFEHVLAIRKSTLAEDHHDQLLCQHNLAGAYKANGQLKEAIELLEHVVAVRDATLAEDNHYRLASMHELAAVYRDNGQVQEALKLLETVVAINAAALAESHPDRLASENDLALTYNASGQVKKAIELLEYVIAVRKATLAEDHPSQLASQYNLAMAYAANGQAEEAIKLLEHVVAVQAVKWPENHPSRLLSESQLARMKQPDNNHLRAFLKRVKSRQETSRTKAVAQFRNMFKLGESGQ